jgi:flagellar basal-body rod protein FlgF
MDRFGYTAMTAAHRTMTSMQVHANNLANANTTGFRADLERAQAASVTGYGYDSRHMAVAVENGVSTSNGALITTGRDLDIAISGRGLIALETADGEAYTRNGNIQIDPTGRMTISGRAVLGEGGPLQLPEFDKVHIGSDGVVSVLPRGEALMAEVGRIKLVDIPPINLTKNETGLLITRNGGPAPASDEIRVTTGHLEASNVSAIDELVASMSLNRLFESQVKMMKAAEDISNAGNRIIRGS